VVACQVLRLVMVVVISHDDFFIASSLFFVYSQFALLPMIIFALVAWPLGCSLILLSWLFVVCSSGHLLLLRSVCSTHFAAGRWIFAAASPMAIVLFCCFDCGVAAAVDGWLLWILPAIGLFCCVGCDWLVVAHILAGLVLLCLLQLVLVVVIADAVHLFYCLCSRRLVVVAVAVAGAFCCFCCEQLVVVAASMAGWLLLSLLHWLVLAADSVGCRCHCCVCWCLLLQLIGCCCRCCIGWCLLLWSIGCCCHCCIFWCLLLLRLVVTVIAAFVGACCCG